MLRLHRAAQQPPTSWPPGLRVRRGGRLARAIAGLAAFGLAAAFAAPAVPAETGPAAAAAGAAAFGRLPAPTMAPPVVVGGVHAGGPAGRTTSGGPAGRTASGYAKAHIVLDGLPAVRVARRVSATAPFVPAPPGPASLTTEVAQALAAKLGQLRVVAGIPGVQVAIIFPDGRSWRGHAGFENYGARVPVKNSTPFPVASVSKTFLAALVVELAQQGRLSLDDPLVTWLPTANVDARVTIREALDHTSGVYDFFVNPKIDDAILGCRTCSWTPAKSLSYLKKPYFEPGTGWAYSNSNYVLLGQLVEQVTGTSYATLLRARFFEPLGLISTYVQVEEAAPYPVVHSYRFLTSSRREKPTSLWDGTGVSPFRSLTTAAGAAGAIASSARDLAVWARELYSGRVLGTEGSRAMLDFAVSVALRVRIPYGLGVQEFTVAGRKAYGHGGRLLGARSAIRYLPDENLSIAVLINTNRGDPAAIADALATLVLPPLDPAPSSSPSPAPASGTPATPTPVPTATIH